MFEKPWLSQGRKRWSVSNRDTLVLLFKTDGRRYELAERLPKNPKPRALEYCRDRLELRLYHAVSHHRGPWYAQDVAPLTRNPPKEADPMPIQVKIYNANGTEMGHGEGHTQYYALRDLYQRMHDASAIRGRFVSSDSFTKHLVELGYEVRIKKIS
jgi:hypothetical protein